MASEEIVANLWYVTDEQGFIYSLRAKLYVAAGTEDDKLSFLRSRAALDYLVARPFSLPAGIKTTIAGPTDKQSFAVIHINDADALGG